MVNSSSNLNTSLIQSDDGWVACGKRFKNVSHVKRNTNNTNTNNTNVYQNMIRNRDSSTLESIIDDSLSEAGSDLSIPIRIPDSLRSDADRTWLETGVLPGALPGALPGLSNIPGTLHDNRMTIAEEPNEPIISRDVIILLRGDDETVVRDFYTMY